MSLSQYPGQVDTFPTHTDNNNEVIAADHMNKVQDAIVAMETDVNAHLADVARFTHNGVRKEYTWENGLPLQERFYDANNNLTKQIDYVWLEGLPQTESYILNDYNELNVITNTQTFTITYTWVNGLPTQEVTG